MTWVAVAVAAAGVVGGAYSAKKQRDAAQDAAAAQQGAAQQGIQATQAAQAEYARQFDSLRAILAPYVQTGNAALNQQGALIGTGGPQAQQQAINSLEQSPQFGALARQGENAILQNASATGGLRGGNTQAALAQFRPQLLSQMIDQQYSRLGGLVSIGQNAAAGTGNAGMALGQAGLNTGANITQLLQQQGAANAGGLLANGRAAGGYANAITQGIGMYAGLGGFGAQPAQQPTPVVAGGQVYYEQPGP
jgi:hypothetical protein